MKHDAARLQTHSLPTHSLIVPMTASLDRLLTKAAGERGQTPEALVKQVLYDWLLADRGFASGRGTCGRKAAPSPS